MEFLQWLLSRFIEMNDLDEDNTTVTELQKKLQDELTPIGGG